MPSILFSKDSTARRYTSIFSVPFSIAEASCLRRSSSVFSIDAIRSHASADRSPNDPLTI